MVKNRSGFAPILIAIAVAVVLALAGAVYVTYKYSTFSTSSGEVLSDGDVTLQGTNGGAGSNPVPDTGGWLYLNTSQYGQLTIGLPGYMVCAGLRQFDPGRIGDTIEVHGHYSLKWKEISICGPGYYVKKL